MKVQQSLINGMLKNIPDKKLRETYGNIINGKLLHKVYCMDPKKDPETKKLIHKKGILIGYLDRNAKAIDEPTANDEGEPIAGIETSRDRFDGRKGFRCYCGNWSIEAEEEQGIINRSPLPSPPTQNDLLEIHANLQKSKKPKAQFINGVMEYDGFKIEEAKS